MGRVLLIAYLDTHIVVWLLDGQASRLTAAAASTVQRCSLLISPMVLLELEYLFEKQRISRSAGEVAFQLKTELDVNVCTFPFPAIAHAALSERWTRDVFDRIIVSHARANGTAPLVSADRRIRENYSGAVWAD